MNTSSSLLHSAFLLLPFSSNPAPGTPWRVAIDYGRVANAAGDRWRVLPSARGKSEHHRAACLAKTRGPVKQFPGNGKCPRKYTAPYHFGRRSTRVVSDQRPKWCGVRVKRRGKS